MKRSDFDRLYHIPRVSGNEWEFLQTLSSMVQNPKADYVTDALGNLIVHIKGNGPKVALCTPVDENGFFVSNVEEDGTVRISPIGAIKPSGMLEQSIKLYNGRDGIICCSKKPEKLSELTSGDLFVDFGCQKKDKLSVSVGEIGRFYTPFMAFGNRFAGTAVSSLAFIICLLDYINSCCQTENDLYICFFVQGKLKNRGAKTALSDICPDVCLTFEASEVQQKGSGTQLTLGKGPAIQLKSGSYIMPSKMRGIMEERLSNILYQYDISLNEGVAGIFQAQQSGMLTGAVSLPVYGLNTSHEIVQQEDIENLNQFIHNILSKKID